MLSLTWKLQQEVLADKALNIFYSAVNNYDDLYYMVCIRASLTLCFETQHPIWEIFVLNPEPRSSPIPVLQDIKTRLPATGEPRLRILHLSGYRYAIPSYAALPLIHKHRKTLETITGNISSMAPMSHLLTSYGHFILDTIRKMIIWFIDHPTDKNSG